MNIGKYSINVIGFQWRPWSRIEIEYEGEVKEKGYAYVSRGWLCFFITHVESFGWEDFQKTVEVNTQSDYDGMGNFSRFGNPPKNT